MSSTASSSVKALGVTRGHARGHMQQHLLAVNLLHFHSSAELLRTHKAVLVNIELLNRDRAWCIRGDRYDDITTTRRARGHDVACRTDSNSWWTHGANTPQQSAPEAAVNASLHQHHVGPVGIEQLKVVRAASCVSNCTLSDWLQ